MADIWDRAHAEQDKADRLGDRVKALETALHDIASDSCATGEGAMALVGRMKIRALNALKSSAS